MSVHWLWVFLVAGNSHCWKPSEVWQQLNHSARTRKAGRKKACCDQISHMDGMAFFVLVFVCLFCCLSEVGSFPAFQSIERHTSILYPGTSGRGSSFKFAIQKADSRVLRQMLVGTPGRGGFVLTGAWKRGLSVLHPLNAWCSEYGFDGC